MGRSSTLGRISTISKISVGIVLGSLIALIFVTWLALEAGGVAILETEGADGTARSTHVWFATPDEADVVAEGELWVEAGTPENGWYVDVVEERTTLTLTSASSSNQRSEISGRYRAQPMPGEAPHLKIRALLREKYGLRDWWIATVFDTSRSVAVRLVPTTSSKASATDPTAAPTPALPLAPTIETSTQRESID